VTVSHPAAQRWGFQLSARLASDESKAAGTLAPNDVVRVICDDGSARGVLAPCAAGAPEFAEHFDAPRTAAGAGFTFSVDWTPPATGAGDVIFYAAGNAANGDGTPNGDRIFTTSRRISGPCGLTQKPSLTKLSNGASFGPEWNAGAMISIFGSNFAGTGQQRLVTSGDLANSQFPQTLNCVAVTVNGQNAPIAYVQGDQINLQAPKLAGVGPATVVVIANPGAANELRSDPMTVNTQQVFAPAFFTFNGKSIAATSGDGTRIVANPSVVTGGVPAKPGDVVVLYATGLGPTNPGSNPGDIATGAAQVTGSVSLTVGGISIPAGDIMYAGLSPGSISGLQQINVRLPSSLPDGDVPVVLSIGGSSSTTGTTIAIQK
jgi:uncharacterized protein (TIGR03437 family)